jgi:hypothetical protein
MFRFQFEFFYIQKFLAESSRMIILSMEDILAVLKAAALAFLDIIVV